MTESTRASRMKAKAVDERRDEHGKLRKMAEADGYVMARRPHCVPFVLSRKKWDQLAVVGEDPPPST